MDRTKQAVKPLSAIGGVVKAPRRLIDMTDEDLDELIADRLAKSLADAFDDLRRNREPDLLGGREMAAKIGVSRSKLHGLRIEGCPSVRVGDTYKFEPAVVMAWLKARGAK